MKKKGLWAALVATLLASLLLVSCGKPTAPTSGYFPYVPEKEQGGGAFDFESNAFSADVTIDGVLDDERWQQSDVVQLGSWDDPTVTSGGLATDYNRYFATQTTVVRMFRGTSGYHWGFEVHDPDVTQKAEGDGDNAINSDNILLNFSTTFDGSVIPMSTDYYILISAFGYKCFRTGAQAAGMWGDWPGVVDFETQLLFTDEADANHATGFVVEIFIPYSSVGMKKDAALPFSFLRVNRKSDDPGYYEDAWIYNGVLHNMNLPNTYAVWTTENTVVNYYEYDCGPVTLKGTVTDVVTGAAVAGVTVSGEALESPVTTDAVGSFTVPNVPSSQDLTLTTAKEGYVNGTIQVGRDAMRGNAGGTLGVSGRIINESNPPAIHSLTGTVTDFYNAPLAGVTVSVGNSAVTTDTAGTFRLTEIPMTDIGNGEEITFAKQGCQTVTRRVTLGDLSPAFTGTVDQRLVPNEAAPLFGAVDTSVLFTRNDEALQVTFSFNQTKVDATKGAVYGFGVALRGGVSKTFAMTNSGQVAWLDYGDWGWSYQSPAAVGVTIEQKAGVWTARIPYERFSSDKEKDIGVIAFDLLLTNEAYGTYGLMVDYDGNKIAVDSGNFMNLNVAGVLGGEATPQPDPDVFADSPVFGAADAKVRLERLDTALKVTFLFDKEKADALLNDYYAFGLVLKGNVTRRFQLANTGNLAWHDMSGWDWTHQPPAQVADGKIVVSMQSGAWSLTIPYELIEATETSEIGLIAFDWRLTNEQYGSYGNMVDSVGNKLLVDGNTFMTLDADCVLHDPVAA